MWNIGGKFSVFTSKHNFALFGIRIWDRNLLCDINQNVLLGLSWNLVGMLEIYQILDCEATEATLKEIKSDYRWHSTKYSWCRVLSVLDRGFSFD